ncbi:MAG: hypothetical protein GY790_22955 [Bacteroidetes bacterium]|nr:hypothetical protein [Bacteroidota bacterium]
MAFSKITRIILFIVAGISLAVVLFFYVSPKTVNFDAMELRVQEAAYPVDLSPVEALPAVDTTANDTTGLAEGVAATEETPAPVAVVVDAPEAKSAREVLSGWELLVWNRVSIALVWAYILIFLTTIAALIFPLLSVLSNPKGLIRLGIVLAGAAVLVVVSYLMASATPLDIIGYQGTGNSDPSTLKMVDTVLFVTYILFGMALVSILYAIVSKAFK